jgi:hypothetical protein
MIQTFCEQLIKELGPTGLLIVGLYGIIYMPLRDAARSLKKINEELSEVITLIREQIIIAQK